MLVPVLAAGWLAEHAVSLVLLAGLGALTVALAVLMWTRWGQAHPIAKCAGLSLFAHLLLVIYLYSTRVFFDVPPGKAKGPVQIQLAQATELENTAPQDAARSAAEPKPWDEISAEPPPETPLPEPPRRELPDLLPAPPPQPQAPITPEPTPPPPPPSPLPDTPAPPPTAQAEAPPTNNDPPPSPAPPQPQEFIAAPPSPPRRPADGQPLPEALQARVSDRLAIAQQYGGSIDTERAVANALHWLAAHQSPDGRWRAAELGAGIETQTDRQNRGGAGRRADTGITGLALLAMLGAGNTHLEGQHRECVQHGLEFLLGSQAADGNLRADAELFAAMYCHGIATLALTEAYAMTGDERLKDGVQRALGYTIRSQHGEGGWRYQPGDIGDLSQFGWQLMALKSGEQAGAAIPAVTRARMAFFLRSVSAGRSGGLGRYRTVDPPSTTMTAEGLACRLFLNAENSPAALREGAAQVLRDLPRRDNVNYYYWYYATLALHQMQGEEWRHWNAALKDELLTTQRSEGDLAGSWDPDRYWGGYGGRVYSTALPALCLEVYYRYLPLLHGDPRFTELPTVRGSR